MWRWPAKSSRVRASARTWPSSPLTPTFHHWSCVKSCLVGSRQIPLPCVALARRDLVHRYLHSDHLSVSLNDTLTQRSLLCIWSSHLESFWPRPPLFCGLRSPLECGSSDPTTWGWSSNVSASRLGSVSEGGLQPWVEVSPAIPLGIVEVDGQEVNTKYTTRRQGPPDSSGPVLAVTSPACRLPVSDTSLIKPSLAGRRPFNLDTQKIPDKLSLWGKNYKYFFVNHKLVYF